MDEAVEAPGSVSQAALFDPEKDWKRLWVGMPAYDQNNLMPWQSLTVHFTRLQDRIAFAEVIGQTITDETKSIWHPEATIRRAANQRYSTEEAVTPRYPVYVISKGRWEARLTIKALEMMRVPYHVVVEPQEYEQYAAVIDPQKIYTLPFSNLGQGGIPARNWVWEHAVSSGAERHWILDDNIWGFCRFNDNLKVEVDSGVTFCAVEDFVDRYENIALAGFHYDYFAPRKQGAKIIPFTLNTRIYSGILIKNDLPYKWRGRYNEDTDLSLRALKDGWCTVLFNAFLMYKAPTLTQKGGNTDELYKGVEATAEQWQRHVLSCARCAKCLDGYGSDALPCDDGRAILEPDGRWRMAESLRAQHPDVTHVERKWQRWQHQVDYRRFKGNKLVLRPGVVLPTEPNEYGMRLVTIEDPPAAAPKVPRERRQAREREAPQDVVEGPSALDFLFGQVAASPSAVPAGEGIAPEPSQAAGQPVSSGQEPPQAASPAASEPEPAAELAADPAVAFYASLCARGHRALTLDGKLFMTNAKDLTFEDRVLVQQHRAALLAVAIPYKPDPEPAPARVEVVAQQNLAQYLGGGLHEGWRADEPPSLDGIPEVVLNFATTGLNWADGDHPVGLTVSTLDGQLTRFLPFGFQGGNLDEATIKRWAERELRDKKIYNANTRFDVHQSRVWGVDLIEQGNTFSDIQHTAALLDDHRKQFRLDVLGTDYLPDLMKVARLDESQHASYHAADVAERERFSAVLVAKLREVLYPQIAEQDLGIVQTLEDNVIPCVVEMEKNGSPIDVELNERCFNECNTRHEQLLREVSEEAGFAFDHTPKSWQRLFEKLGLPPTIGNSESVIATIDHPLVQKAYFSSQLASLNSKTFGAYRTAVGSDGILRFSINQLRGDDGGTVSGRFSIGYVQQVPNHDNHHAAFGVGNIDECNHNTCELYPRRVFIPGPDAGYLDADAAQIEYRLLAHYAENQQIIEAYRENPDLSFHKLTWERIKSYKPDMLYSHQKSFNFARQYGARAIKLAIMMNFITEAEGDEIRKAKRWNDPRLATIKEIEAAYDKMMPEGSYLLDYAAHLAKPACDKYCKTGDKFHERSPHRGYVRTLLGRRSRFGPHSKTYIGLNRILQGTGADIMKQKLVELFAARKTTGFLMRMTVHDAVGGDAQSSEALGNVSAILNAQSFPLAVKIVWTAKTGATWAACK